ncbi:unnamed protein product [Ascophyllum nodosum]
MRGCQSSSINSTWSTGQDKIRGTSTKLQREHKNKKQNKTITQSTCQKKIEEGHCKEVQRSTCHIMVTAPAIQTNTDPNREKPDPTNQKLRKLMHIIKIDARGQFISIKNLI